MQLIALGSRYVPVGLTHLGKESWAKAIFV